MAKEIIEGFNGFKDALTKFVEQCSKDEELIIRFTNFSVSNDARTIHCNIDSLINTLFCKDIADYIKNQDDFIEVESNTNILQLAGANFLWWNENARRRNQLKSAFDDTPVQDSKPAKLQKEYYDKNAKYSVAIADLTEEGLCHIDYFQGTKAECLQWLNKMIVRHTDLNEQSIMVFDLHFKQEHTDYLQYSTEWKTLNELVDDGKVTI